MIYIIAERGDATGPVKIGFTEGKKVVKVRSCDGCPFRDDEELASTCRQESGRVIEFYGQRLRAPDRPDWCPLELGPVVVEVDRG